MMTDSLQQRKKKERPFFIKFALEQSLLRRPGSALFFFFNIFLSLEKMMSGPEYARDYNKFNSFQI